MALIVVITILLIAYQFNCMLYNSYITNYHLRKKKLLNLLINVSTSIRGRYQKERKPREYWVGLELGGTILYLELCYRNNFRMSKNNFYKLCEELQPFICRQATIMRSPVEVERQVALALYYRDDSEKQQTHLDYLDLAFQ